MRTHKKFALEKKVPMHQLHSVYFIYALTSLQLHGFCTSLTCGRKG